MSMLLKKLDIEGKPDGTSYFEGFNAKAWATEIGQIRQVNDLPYVVLEIIHDVIDEDFVEPIDVIVVQRKANN